MKFPLLLAAVLAALPLPAQQSAAFTLDFPGQDPAWYRITVDADGNGEYSTSPAQSIRFQLSPEAAQQWLAAAARCDAAPVTELKKVAFLGRKTLVLRSPAGKKTIAWISPHEGALMAFTRLAESLGETLWFGQRLAHDQRFDRLELDKDMKAWQGALKSGDASQPQAIAVVLQQIASDEQVMERVRRAAETALATR